MSDKSPKIKWNKLKHPTTDNEHDISLIADELMVNIGVDLAARPDHTTVWRFKPDGTVEFITADQLYKENL
jgi:hypothetical protein